uniref:Arginine-hydroxylase NDUFAF5, mitochondrial n=1 Tax=Gouania willdenowi TaxID=441366 RepID=A0A8C5G726_GOUWI
IINISRTKGSTSSSCSMNVFDRQMKRNQKIWSQNQKNFQQYNYLRQEEVCASAGDSISCVCRTFPLTLDLSGSTSFITEHLSKDVVQRVVLTNVSPHTKYTHSEIPTMCVSADEEFLPFKENSFDLVLSSMTMHWINDLPGALRQVCSVLKPDGVFLGAMVGGDSLFELRCSLQLSECEREGGFSPHVSPFTSVNDVGNLMSSAGFNLLTVDVDDVRVNYPGFMELMMDLQGMGESNCALNRRSMLHRDSMLATAAIYKELYGNDDGSIPATFNILFMIGWKPHASQVNTYYL